MVHNGTTVWRELRDVTGRPADFIPQLLDAMKSGQPEERRQAAETEFWDSIYGLEMLCTATAPGVNAYLTLVDAGEIAFSSGLAPCIADLLAEACVVEKNATHTRLAMKAEVRAAIQRRKELFVRVFETHPDVDVKSQTSELLARLGDPEPKRSVVAPLLRELHQNKDDPDRWALLLELDSRSGEIKDWEKHLNLILRNERGVLQFHAACSLVKFCEGNPTSDVITALRELPKLASQNLFGTCITAFSKAAASLPVGLTMDIVESVLVPMTDVLKANDVCRGLLIAVFQPRAKYEGFEMNPGIEELDLVWKPKKPYPHARKLSAADLGRLCTILAGCDALWLDRKGGRTVRTNLWSLFRLPGDRESMRQFAARKK